MEIKELNIIDLKPAEYNPRQSTAKQEEHLKKSLDKFGVVEPIIVNIHKDRENVIVGGHFRVRELKKLGHKTVPCVIVDLPLKDEKELNVRLNKNTGEFDFDILANEFEIEDLQEWGFEDFELGIAEEEAEIVEDEAPEVQNDPICKKGDVWILGEHRLVCGDATNIDDVKKLMGEDKADMVFTDPPYNTGMTSKTQNSTRLSHMFNDSYTDEEWANFMQDFVSMYYMQLKEDSVAYICLDWRRNYELIPIIKENGFKLSNIIVWDKVVHGLGSDYKYTYELINVCKKGKLELNTHQGDKEYSDVWHIQRKIGKDEEHATKKPIELVTRSLRHASIENDIILDLFGGSGSTLIACEQLNRKCRMMELDERYCDVIIKRYINLKNNSDDVFLLLNNNDKIGYDVIKQKRQ